MKKSFSGMWNNNTIEKTIKKQLGLTSNEIDKSWAKMRKSMRKGDKEGLMAEVKKLARREETSRTTIRRFKNAVSEFRSAADILDKVAPYNVGIGSRFDPIARFHEIVEENREFTREIHGIMNQSMGSRGSLLRRSPNDLATAPNYRRADDDSARYYSGMYELDYETTGQLRAARQRVWLTNLQRGIRSYSQLNSLTRQGLQLGTLLGVNAEQTSEELSDWNQHLGLSVRQTATLSHNMVAVSLATGLTGDRLLSATRSARQFAEVMRDAGTLTDQSARNLVQMSAVSSQRGTENIIAPLRNAMTNGFFDADAGITAFLTSAAANSGNTNGVMDALINEQLMNSRRGGVGLDAARGMRQTALNLIQQIGGANVTRVDQLTPQQLMQANQVARRGFSMPGIQAMFLAADTMRDTFELTADTMNRLTEESRRVNITEAERIDLQTQIRMLNRRQIQEGMNESITNMGSVTAGSMSRADVNRNINSIIAGLQENANNLTGPGTETHRQTLNNRIAEINRLRGDGNLSEAQYRTLMDEIHRARGDNAVVERRFQSSESEIQAANQIAWQERMEKDVINMLGWIQRNAPEQTSLLNTSVGLLQGLLSIASSALTILGQIPILLGMGGILYGLHRLWQQGEQLRDAVVANRTAQENAIRLANKQTMDRAAYAQSIRDGAEDEHYRNEYRQGHHMLRDIDLGSQISEQQMAANNLHGLTEAEITSGRPRSNGWGGVMMDQTEFHRRRQNVIGARANLAALQTERDRRRQISKEIGGANFENDSRNSVLIDLAQMIERANGSASLGGTDARNALTTAGINHNDLRTRVLTANPNAQGMELTRLMVDTLRREQPNLFTQSARTTGQAGPNQVHANGGAPSGSVWNSRWNQSSAPNGFLDGLSTAITGSANSMTTLQNLVHNGVPYEQAVNITRNLTDPLGSNNPNNALNRPSTIPIPMPGVNPFGFPTIMNIPTNSILPGMSLPPTGTASASTASPLNNYSNAQQAVDRNIGDINNSTKLTAEETHEIRVLIQKLVDILPEAVRNRGQNATNVALNPNFYNWSSQIS